MIRSSTYLSSFTIACVQTRTIMQTLNIKAPGALDQHPTIIHTLNFFSLCYSGYITTWSAWIRSCRSQQAAEKSRSPLNNTVYTLYRGKLLHRHILIETFKTWYKQFVYYPIYMNPYHMDGMIALSLKALLTYEGRPKYRFVYAQYAQWHWRLRARTKAPAYLMSITFLARIYLHIWYSLPRTDRDS